ncbi:MAG: glyoxalase [Lachnospiraceae bacterium]|nr:glyoxalase [Lachnospiraceae bacterium]
MAEPTIKKILQISMVVDDAKRYAKCWNDDYGIGPWTFLHFDETTLDAQRIEGAPAKWGVELALCDALNVQIELIEPLYGDTTYMQFLKEYGPGLHHMAVEPTGGFPAWKEFLQARGKDHFIVGGNEMGAQGQRQFEYVDLRDELGVILETYHDTDGFMPGPVPFDGTYPKE